MIICNSRVIFLTRRGRRVPDSATDQPGTEMLVRTQAEGDLT